jgi:hypothetical protein
MAHYDDLSPCDYFPGPSSSATLLAVGWLEPGYPYPTGDPGSDVYDRLREFAVGRPWQPGYFFGGHLCRLGACRYSSCYSHQNFFIPGRDVVYVAPEGILHYISCHDYLPPAEFCAAVLALPPDGSPEYFAALRASGVTEAHGPDPESIRHDGLTSIVEARGRALVEAIQLFRDLRGRWPDAVDEANGLVDDAGTWRYTSEERGFTLEADWRVREGFSMRYESRLGVWSIATGFSS